MKETGKQWRNRLLSLSLSLSQCDASLPRMATFCVQGRKMERKGRKNGEGKKQLSLAFFFPLSLSLSLAGMKEKEKRKTGEMTIDIRKKRERRKWESRGKRRRGEIGLFYLLFLLLPSPHSPSLSVICLSSRHNFQARKKEEDEGRKSLRTQRRERREKERQIGRTSPALSVRPSVRPSHRNEPV